MKVLYEMLRRPAIKVLRRWDPGDITIRHHWTGDRIRLDAYRHKGYWWHGRFRERETITFCQDILSESDTVIECGGHIGYVSLLLSSLVGPTGAVYVFEPGPNNLPYLRHNASCRSNIHVVERAVGAKTAVLPLYVDDFTGQNNSLVKGYTVVGENSRRARIPIATEPIATEVVTLDEFCQTSHLTPDFVKLDIEGFEIEALRGMPKLLGETIPMLMVELTRDWVEVHDLLSSAGYAGFTDRRTRIDSVHDLPSGNTFWLHPSRHRERLSRIGKTAAA